MDKHSLLQIIQYHPTMQNLSLLDIYSILNEYEHKIFCIMNQIISESSKQLQNTLTKIEKIEYKIILQISSDIFGYFHIFRMFSDVSRYFHEIFGRKSYFNYL